MKQTFLCERHLSLGARMADFAGWNMPIQYPKGIVAEHLATRKQVGLFDVSHMGRFRIRGRGAMAFLQSCLTNNAATLSPGMSHYTLLANDRGGAIDDAYLYQLVEDDYLLVVNASNARKDFDYLTSLVSTSKNAELTDISDSVAMVAVQGPQAQALLKGLLDEGDLPPARRNALQQARVCGAEATIARTGYTGEPVCFEVFIEAKAVGTLWDALLERGAEPVGLGARDTLRLEASLPLYGHEFGLDHEGSDIPILSCPTARFGVSFESENRDFEGKTSLMQQAEALKRYAVDDFSQIDALPKVLRPFRLTDSGIARAGAVVYDTDRPVGVVTSGTMAPYWVPETDKGSLILTEQRGQRAIGLSLITPDVPADALLEVDVRGRRLGFQLVRRNLENRRGDTAVAVL